MGMIGAVLVALLLLATVFADFLSPYSPVARNPDAIYSPPQRCISFADDGFHLDPLHQSDDDRDRPDDLPGRHQGRH